MISYNMLDEGSAVRCFKNEPLNALFPYGGEKATKFIVMVGKCQL